MEIKSWCFCMVALPVTWKCILNVSRNISMSIWMDIPRDGKREGGEAWRRKEGQYLDAHVGWVEGRGSVDCCYFNASPIYFKFGIQGAERKKESKVRLFISDTTDSLRWLIPVYYGKLQLSWIWLNKQEIKQVFLVETREQREK